MSRNWLIVGIGVAAVVGGLVTGLVMGSQLLAPVRASVHYPYGLLAEEAAVMNDCVECHEPEDFHTCSTCHDDHGSAEMAMVPFNDLILLAGDVPEPGYIAVNDILPYRDQPGTHVRLLDFLAEREITDFQSVTLASRDGGFVTFEPANLTEEALLMPHVDGVRFAAENLHVSTWLKGVWHIVVVGTDRPMVIDGQPTSIGRLLLGPTRSVTIDQTEVMLKSESDGQIRRARTASRIEGAPVESIVEDPGFQELGIRDAQGEEHTLAARDARNAVLAQVRSLPGATLVLPGRSRAQWIVDVIEISSRDD
jgi:hypothetical protein